MPSPPITIGELTDVPAFNSPIASPWAQETSRRIAHRFATTAERDSKYPAASAGAGALCAVTPSSLYMSDGTGWLVLTERPIAATGPLFSLHWGQDPARPPITAGPQPSSATATAFYSRRGWNVDFVLNIFSGAAGGLGAAGFNLPFPHNSFMAHGAFAGSWLSNTGALVPCWFYVATGWQPVFYGGAAVGSASPLLQPGGSVPFPSTPNQTMNVHGTYLTDAAPYG